MSWLKLDDGKIALAIRTRNYLTHRNPKDKKGAATEKETFLLSHILRCMFEINVLTDLQFSKDDIVNLLDKNQRYAHIREELAHRKINPTSFPRGI
jgi:hypothetical protein